MSITITYDVDKDQYHKSDKKHEISLITTEYQCGNELLVHILLGKNLGIRLNNQLGDLLTIGKRIPNEQFLFKKTYNQGNSKLITHSTFEAKIK